MQGVPERRRQKLSQDVGVATDVVEPVSSRISLPEVPVNIVNRGIGRRSLHVTAGRKQKPRAGLFLLRRRNTYQNDAVYSGSIHERHILKA